MLGEEHLEHVGVLEARRPADGGEHSRREPELQGDAVGVAGPRAAPGPDEDLVAFRRLSNLLDEREDGGAAPVHQALTAELDDVQLGQDANRRAVVGPGE